MKCNRRQHNIRLTIDIEEYVMQYMIVDAHNDIDILCIRTIFIINIIYIYRDDFNINQSWLTSESAAGQDFHKVVL